jgi:alpha-L-rhamnosidase
LVFVAMMHDHYGWFGDGELVRGYLGTVDGVLGYFRGLVDMRGLVSRFDDEDWAFVDWVKEWQRPGGLRGMGTPPSYLEGEDGVATVHSLVYAWALGLAAELCDVVGRNDTGREYSQRAEEILVAVNARCWDGTFFTDGIHETMVSSLEANAHSQHTQIWAILAGAVQGEQATNLLRRTMSAKDMPRCSYAMSFYVFRAAAKTGLYEELWPRLIRPWEDMLAQNLITFAEDDVGVRSDCHGWSGVPIWEIATELFGVRPETWPGRRNVKPKVNLLGNRRITGEFVVGSEGKKVRVEVEQGVATVTTL